MHCLNWKRKRFSFSFSWFAQIFHLNATMFGSREKAFTKSKQKEKGRTQLVHRIFLFRIESMCQNYDDQPLMIGIVKRSHVQMSELVFTQIEQNEKYTKLRSMRINEKANNKCVTYCQRNRNDDVEWVEDGFNENDIFTNQYFLCLLLSFSCVSLHSTQDL